MSITTRILGGAAALLFSSVAFLSPATADAPEVFSNGATEQDVEKFFNAHSVPEGTQKVLIRDLKRGDLLDADNGSTPVSSTKEQRGAFEVTRYTYPDGSVSVSTIERPDLQDEDSTGPIAAPMASRVGDCRYTRSGSGYVAFTDCLAYHESTGLGIGMRVDYTLSQAYDSIGKVYAGSGYKVSYGRTADGPTLRLVRSQETSTARAAATATGYWRASNGSQSGLYRMTFSVGSNNPSTSLTF